jgi:ACT domain-containing protein
MNQEFSSTIDARQTKNKELLIEQLKRTPIVELACQKVGIGRATYYRFRKDDKNFGKAADEAIIEGSLLVNDIAETQLIGAIKDKNMSAILFWLKHHHPAYKNKLEVTGELKTSLEALTPEQEALVKRALKLAGLIEPKGG